MVTIVVPNHSEPQIDQTLQGLLTLGCKVVVANDPEGKGVGWAMREGLKDVTTEWTLFVMADGSEDLGSLEAMIIRCDFYVDAVYGDRWGTYSTTLGYPLLKRRFNRMGNWLISILLADPAYSDWTDLAKAYRTDRLRRISWSDDFRCEVEIPLRYKAQRVSVVPMHWRERSAGVSSYRLLHALGCLWALGKVILRG